MTIRRSSLLTMRTPRPREAWEPAGGTQGGPDARGALARVRDRLPPSSVGSSAPSWVQVGPGRGAGQPLGLADSASAPLLGGPRGHSAGPETEVGNWLSKTSRESARLCSPAPGLASSRTWSGRTVLRGGTRETSVLMTVGLFSSVSLSVFWTLRRWNRVRFCPPPRPRVDLLHFQVSEAHPEQRGASDPASRSGSKPSSTLCSPHDFGEPFTCSWPLFLNETLGSLRLLPTLTLPEATDRLGALPRGLSCPYWTLILVASLHLDRVTGC